MSTEGVLGPAALTPAPAPTAPPAPAPTTPEAAAARLDERIKDKAWRDKLYNGDSATLRERSELVALKNAATPEGRLDNAMAGTPSGTIETISPENPLSTSQLYSAVKHLREGGLSDAVIKDAISGAEITQQQHDAFEIFKKRCLSDREWVKRYRSGDSDARADFLLFSAGVTAPVKP
jgi:hypothetical protein